MRRLPSALLFSFCLLSLHASASGDGLMVPRIELVHGRELADVTVEDESGARFELSTLKETQKVLILAPFYTRCKASCSPLTDSLKLALEKSRLPLSDYQVLSFSFDPDETDARLADFRKRHHLPSSWKTVRTDQAGIGRVLDTIDFHTLSLTQGEFQHANIVAVFNPSLHLEGFLTNAAVDAGEIKTLVRAAEGKTTEAMLLNALLAIGFFGFAASLAVVLYIWFR